MYLCIYLFICLFAFSGAAPAAYGGSQASGPIGAVATSLRHSHSNAGSEPNPQPTPQLLATQILNPLSKARDRTRSLMVSSQILQPLRHDRNSCSVFVAICILYSRVLGVFSE